MTSRWLTDKDLAEHYGVHRITIWKWARELRLPAPHKIGPSTTRWLASDIAAHDDHIAGVAG